VMLTRILWQFGPDMPLLTLHLFIRGLQKRPATALLRNTSAQITHLVMCQQIAVTQYLLLKSQPSQLGLLPSDARTG
jgi:hypothetical protein